MITITKNFDIYNFDELEKTAKEKAINETIEIEIEIMDDPDTNPYQDCVDEMERMHTPWFLGECIWEYHSDMILDILNNYYFLKDGEIAPPDYYPE